ncbi:MAG: hypothetical protein ACM3VS_13395 [Candidatus Dadabacteria bacterium]
MQTPVDITPAKVPSIYEEIFKPGNWFDESRFLDKVHYPRLSRGYKDDETKTKATGVKNFNFELKAFANKTSSEKEEGGKLGINFSNCRKYRNDSVLHSATFRGDTGDKRRDAWFEMAVLNMIQPSLAGENTIQSPGG